MTTPPAQRHDRPIDLDALATNGDPDHDENLTEVTTDQISSWARQHLHVPDAADAFAIWLNREWNGFTEGDTCTNRDVLTGALIAWRGDNPRDSKPGEKLNEIAEHADQHDFSEEMTQRGTWHPGGETSASGIGGTE